MDSYHILGVSPDDCFEDIKLSYYKLARRYHPDKSSQPDPTRFLEIQEAWNSLRSQFEKPKLSVMANIVEFNELEIIDEYTYSYPCRCGECYEVGFCFSSTFLIPF